MDPKQAFQAFPESSLTCVQLSDDKDADTGCQPKCTSESLSYGLYNNYISNYQYYSWNTHFSTNTCTFKSRDSLTTFYCSQVNNGNQPLLSNNCYQGAFSAETPLKPIVITYLLF